MKKPRKTIRKTNKIHSKVKNTHAKRENKRPLSFGPINLLPVVDKGDLWRRVRPAVGLEPRPQRGDEGVDEAVVLDHRLDEDERVELGHCAHAVLDLGLGDLEQLGAVLLLRRQGEDAEARHPVVGLETRTIPV